MFSWRERERERERVPFVSPLVFALDDDDDKSGWPSKRCVRCAGDDGKEVSRCGGNGRFSANNKASGVEWRSGLN